MAALGCGRAELYAPAEQRAGGGGASGGCAVDCRAIPAPSCAIGVCDPGLGVCKLVSAPDGAACDDGKACTSADVCQGGVCAGQEVSCGGPTAPCQRVVCREANHGCAAEPSPDGDPCALADKCQVGAACLAGMCVGHANDCSADLPPDECHALSCDKSDGTCKPVAAHNGAPCLTPPPDECHTMQCAAGLCQPVVANDAQPCLAPPPDECHVMHCAGGNCVAVPGNDGKSCSDKCSPTATCQAGSCKGPPKDCAALDSGPLSAACFVGVCLPASGQCVTTVAEDATACSTGVDYCAGEVCTAGTCGPGGSPIAVCKNGDKCCPAVCSAQNDDDCTKHLALGDEFTCLRLGTGGWNAGASTAEASWATARTASRRCR